MKTTILPRDSAIAFWEAIEPHVAEALAHDLTSSLTVADVHHQVEQGYVQVLLITEGSEIIDATVLQIYEDEQHRRTLHVIATGANKGSMVNWLGLLLDTLDQIAVDHLCPGGVTMTGRPGWQKVLAPYGYRTQQVFMRKEADHGRNVQEPAEQQAALAVGK